MSATTAMSGDSSKPRAHGPYVGWWAAGVVLLVTFAASAATWFIFHPW